MNIYLKQEDAAPDAHEMAIKSEIVIKGWKWEKGSKSWDRPKSVEMARTLLCWMVELASGMHWAKFLD